MARIELFPVQATDRALDDPEEGARLKKAVQDSAVALERLSPVMKAIATSNDLAFYASTLTMANVDDFVVALQPFMDVPADEVRWALTRASFTEWLDAFTWVQHEIEQALANTSMLGKNGN